MATKLDRLSISMKTVMRSPALVVRTAQIHLAVAGQEAQTYLGRLEKEGATPLAHFKTLSLVMGAVLVAPAAAALVLVLTEEQATSASHTGAKTNGHYRSI